MLNGSASPYPRGGDCGSPRVGPLPTRPPRNRTRTHQDRRQPGRGSTARGEGDRAATGRTGPLRRTPGTTHPRGEPRATGEGPISNSLLPLFLPSPSPHPTPPHPTELHRVPPHPTLRPLAPSVPVLSGGFCCGTAALVVLVGSACWVWRGRSGWVLVRGTIYR